MSLPIITSPDITLLDFAILYDISVGIPSITLTNQSVGNPSADTNLDNCTWWYTITTPSGVYIHQGTQASPDVTDDTWTTLTIPSGSWPTPFGTPPYGQVEFSCGVPYIATLYVQDSDDNVYSIAKRVAICRPNGNTEKTKGSFGVAFVQVTVKCASASIYTLDTTNYTYQNIIGDFNSNTWTLDYPRDDQGNLPAPVVVTNQGRVIFPVGYSAEGYQLALYTKASYDMGDSQTIKIQYKFSSVFSVWCNISLCAIQCQIDGLMKLNDPSCGKVTDPAVLQKLQQIGWLATQAIIGIEEPLCGIDVPAIIEKAKLIGGIPCDCGATGGINPIASTDGLINIALALTGLTGDVTNVGNNYTITLEVPGAAAGTLQVVTDNGNVTTKNIIVGNASAAFSNTQPTKTEIWSTPSQLLAGIGGASIPGAKGSLWLHAIGFGTVYLQPGDSSNTWTFKLPVDDALATGQALLKDPGAGAYWGSVTGDLQTVTDSGNITTHDVISGISGAKTGTLNDEYFIAQDGGITIVKIGMLPIVGPGLQIKGNSNSFLATIYNNLAIANRAFTAPIIRDGQFALSGLGTICTIVAGAGAGTSPTVSLGAGSNHVAGVILITTGTTPAASDIIVTVKLGIEYLANGVLWRPVFSPGNAISAQAIGLGSVFGSQITLGLPDGDAFRLNSTTTPLLGSASYIFFYNFGS